MRDGEWRLLYAATDLSFGTPATPVFNRTTPDLGTVDIVTDDADRPRQDGRAMGTDTRGALTVTFDLGVLTGSEAETRREVAALGVAWRADAVRRSPGAVAELHSCYAGRERLLYGRPRRFAPNLSDVRVNHLGGATATFDAVDDVFYDAAEQTVTVALIPPVGGGLVAPLAAPLTSTASSDRSVIATVGGQVGAWPVFEIVGPITNPVVEVLGVLRIEVLTSLADGDSLVLDTRPWARTALLNGTGTLAGSLRGSRLSQAAIPPGSHEVVLRGLDATGTALVRLRWRDAYTTP